jgi:Domain of unknown function (DUF4129)
MESSPKQPENNTQEPQGVSPVVHRLKGWILAPEEPTVSSIGEFILPYLLGVMQACWIAAILIGLASTHLFASSETLIPLWSPFFIISASLFLFYYLGLRTSKKATFEINNSVVRVVIPETTVFLMLIGALSLFFVWLYLYTQIAFIFDPNWLLSLVRDILLLDANFYTTVCIIILTYLLGWLGIRLINRNVEPSDVFRALCTGLGVFIVVVILRTGQASAILLDDTALLLLIPLFLFLALMAHALARVVFIRKSHPSGLQGSIVAQERAIILLIGVLGLAFLLIALLIGGTINPASLANVQYVLAILREAYNWLVGIIAAILVIPVIPIFWLISLLPRPTQPSKVTRLHQVQNTVKPDISAWQITFVHTIIPILSIILPILFISLMTILMRWTLRRRQRVRKRVNRHNQDVHESVWTWPLFWMQLRSMVLALFARFIHRDTTNEDGVIVIEEIKGEPAVRNIREIYRALLKKAARHGYPRKRFETPYEFKQRLDEKVPLIEPQLKVITEAYAFTRYGGSVPDEAQLAQVRSNWLVLDQKWN